MNLANKNQFFSFLVLLCLCFSLPTLQAQEKFTLVIDAGHGGTDPGTKGKKITEKKITLAVALKLGSLIEKNHRDVKLIYTRKSDTYLTLKERTELANKNNANLFISIHVNWAKNKKVTGAETYTFGLSKTKSNFEVAKRENSVILLEDDYKAKYQGFDPQSTESYIMFEFLQDKFYDKSIDLASKVQMSLTQYCKRADRGVRQQPFWVLHQAACPSILIELGFVSNWEEEKFLSSPKNQQELARAIYKAFVDYKQEFDKKNSVAALAKNKEEKKPDKKEQQTADQKTQKQDNKEKEKEKKKEQEEKNKKDKNKQEANNQPSTIFKIQILASKTKYSSNDKVFKGLKNVDYYQEGEIYKYTVGSSKDYNEIVELKKEVQKQFKSAFIVKFVDGKRE